MDPLMTFGERIVQLAPFFKVWADRIGLEHLGVKSRGDFEFTAGEFALVLVVLDNIQMSQANSIEVDLGLISKRFDRWVATTSNRAHPFKERCSETIKVSAALIALIEKEPGRSSAKLDHLLMMANSPYFLAARVFLKLMRICS